jgi:CHAD domain-containing protein
MAFRLKDDESVAEGVKRIALEQMNETIDQLTGQSDDPAEAVHEARKQFKKLRAILRLVRNDLGEEIYRRENVFFRDAGRRLSGARDAEVVVQTLDKLSERFADRLSPDTFARVRQALVANRQPLSQQGCDEKAAMLEVAASLDTARQRVQEWPIRQKGWSTLRKGLKQVYKGGYQRFSQAYDQPTAANFHEWRKIVKYFWYHLLILETVWPEVMKTLADQVHKLSEYLGDEHDLVVLRNTVEDQPELFGDSAQLEDLIDLIDRRRDQLHEAAKPLGQRVYAEKPASFANRMKAYWGVWRSEVRQPVSVEAEA